jgi:hypothetical protein
VIPLLRAASARRDIVNHEDRSWVRNGTSSDILLGRPTVVIPLSRAVVCGEDHVYDGQQFGTCPNCSAQERLLLEDLLAHRRRLCLAH